MPKFRKKPVVIEAVQWFPFEDWDDMRRHMDAELVVNPESQLVIGTLVGTLEGKMFANPGDWIIKGVQGEFYPYKPDIFEATYEPVED